MGTCAGSDARLQIERFVEEQRRRGWIDAQHRRLLRFGLGEAE